MNNKQKELNPFLSLYSTGLYRPQCDIELIDDEIEISGKIIKCKKTIIKPLKNNDCD